MKFNLLYILLLLTAVACYYMMRHLVVQSEHSFFGAAETEGRVINVDFAAMIQEIRVRPGIQVKKGDTLALLSRAELDQKGQVYSLDLQQLATEQRTKDQLLEQERTLLRTRQQMRLANLENDLRALEVELSMQNQLKNALGAPPKTGEGTDTALRIRIAALQEQIAGTNRQNAEELAEWGTRQEAQQKFYRSKVQQVRQSVGFVEAERPRLAIVSPLDGYVEQVSGVPLEMIQAYRELFKITPSAPNKVIGFIHESAQIPFRMGDTVLLSSVTRTGLNCKGIIHAVSPKMVELPFRLRKFTEVRTWGREIFIQIPPDNPFFIGEKILAETH